MSFCFFIIRSLSLFWIIYLIVSRFWLRCAAFGFDSLLGALMRTIDETPRGAWEKQLLVLLKAYAGAHTYCRNIHGHGRARAMGGIRCDGRVIGCEARGKGDCKWRRRKEMCIQQESKQKCSDCGYVAFFFALSCSKWGVMSKTLCEWHGSHVIGIYIVNMHAAQLQREFPN